MDRSHLSFLVGLGKSADDQARDFLRGTDAEANAALEYLDANLRNGLLGAALGILGDREMAEDVVRSALYEVLRNREVSACAFDRRASREDGVSPYAFVRAQLFRTLHRRACDARRKHRRHGSVPLDEAREMAAPLELTDPLLHKLLSAAVSNLDEGARLAVASRLAGCETHDEAAEYMGTTRAEAAAAWRRAVYRLRLAPALGLYVRSLDALAA